MPKKAGFVFVIAGTALLIAALSLFLYNAHEAENAGQAAESLLAEMKDTIQKVEQAESSSDMETPADPAIDDVPEMIIVEIDGYGYIGYLSFPSLELELPVMAEWDYTRLKIAPCRQFGSTRTDDLVIAAHNYARHFGTLSKLAEGDKVVFTEMDGMENQYTVAYVDTLTPTSVEAVQNSGYDLVLYTCTPGGRTRVTVFCTRIENPAAMQ